MTKGRRPPAAEPTKWLGREDAHRRKTDAERSGGETHARERFCSRQQVLAEELLCTLNSGCKVWKTAAEIATNLVNRKHDERKHAKVCEPAFQADILRTKQKIAQVLDSMDVEQGIPIAYKKLQDAYEEKHGIPLDSKEIKNLFQTPQAKKAFRIYCPDEFEVHDGDSGMWCITTKMTLPDMRKFHDEQALLRLTNSRRLGENFMRNRSEYTGERAENRERLVEERVNFPLVEH